MKIRPNSSDERPPGAPLRLGRSRRNRSLRHDAVQRHARVPVSLPVRVATIDSELDRVTQQRYFRSAEETLANVSESGLFVQSDEPISAGCRVLIEFSLPNGQRLQALGRVAWSRRRVLPGEGHRETGFGVEFVDLDAPELAPLKALIRGALDAPTAAGQGASMPLAGA